MLIMFVHWEWNNSLRSIIELLQSIECTKSVSLDVWLYTLEYMHYLQSEYTLSYSSWVIKSPHNAFLAIIVTNELTLEFENIPIDNTDFFIKNVPKDIVDAMAGFIYPSIQKYFEEQKNK